eukprot:s662_g25.t1
MRVTGWDAQRSANYVSQLRNLVDLDSTAPVSAFRQVQTKPIEFLKKNESRILEGSLKLDANTVITPIQFRSKARELGFEAKGSAEDDGLRPKAKATPKPSKTETGISSYEVISAASGNDTLNTVSSQEMSSLSSSDSGPGSTKRLRRETGFIVVTDDLATEEMRAKRLTDICEQLSQLNDKLLNNLSKGSMRPPEPEKDPQPKAAAASAPSASGQVDPAIWLEKGEHLAKTLGDTPAADKPEETIPEDDPMEGVYQIGHWPGLQNWPLAGCSPDLLIVTCFFAVVFWDPTGFVPDYSPDDEEPETPAQPKPVDFTQLATDAENRSEVLDRVLQLLEQQKLRSQALVARQEVERTRANWQEEAFTIVLGNEPLKLLDMLEEVTESNVLMMRDGNGLNLLHQCCRIGCVAVVEKLLSINASLSDQMTSPNGRPAFWSPLMVLLDSKPSMWEEDYKYLMNVVLHSSSLATLEARAANGSSALHMACSRGQWWSTKKMLYSIYAKAGSDQGAFGLVTSLVNQPNGRGAGCVPVDLALACNVALATYLQNVWNGNALRPPPASRDGNARWLAKQALYRLALLFRQTRCSEDEGAPLGAPVDQTRAWRRLARRRQKKAAHFLQDRHCQWMTLLWAVLTSPVMVVHYKLFKRGTWFNERPELSEGGSAAASTFRAAAWDAFLQIGDFLLQQDAVQVPAWIPLVGMYGSVLSWSQDRLRAVRRCIVTLLGQLWRKLLAPWQKYPWKLVDMMQDHLREGRARLFFSERTCVLDCFSFKLRSFLESVEKMLEPASLEFLQAVFDRVVLTSTFIERAFARLNRWCEKKGPKPQLSTLAAKHATYHFKNITEQWRDKARKKGLIPKKRSNKCRPGWSHGVRKGRAVNGLHMFAKEKGLSPRSGIARQWRLVSPEEKRRYAALARGQNLQSKAVSAARKVHQEQGESLRGGFWGMSAPTGFPMAREVASEHLDDAKLKAKEFAEMSRSLRPEASDSFDGAPAMQEPLVLVFESAIAGSAFHAAVAYNTRKKPIEAAMLDLSVRQEERRPAGTLFALACETRDTGHLAMVGDVEFCLRMAQRASDWEGSILTVGPVRKMDQFDIVASTPIDWAALQREMAPEKEMQGALTAWKKLHRKADADKGRKRQAMGPRAAAGPAKRLHVAQPAKPISGDEEGWGAGSSQSVSASDAESEPEAGPGPPAPVVVRRPKMRRGQIWGTNPAFQIAPIHAGGSPVPTGWGAICGLHSDPGRPGLRSAS